MRGLTQCLAVGFAFGVVASCAGNPATGGRNAPPTLSSYSVDEQRTALASWIGVEERLLRVALPLMTANTALCREDVTPWLGIYAVTDASFEPEWRPAARSMLGVGREPVVIYNIPETPAYRAGLRRGDVIKAINGQSLSERAASPVTQDQWLAEAGAQDFLDLVYERDGMIGAVRVQTAERCNYGVVLEDNRRINAYADGANVIISTGLLDFVESEEELALIISHEMAHNALDHVDSRRENARSGAVSGLLIDLLFGAAGIETNGEFTRAGMAAGAITYSIDYENEADYVALYYMARAGVDVEPELADFWRRVALIDPDSIDRRFTHPTLPERYVALRRTAAEIAEKDLAGIPLSPDFRGARTVRAVTGDRPWLEPAAENDVTSDTAAAEPEPPVDFTTPLEIEADGDAGV